MQCALQVLACTTTIIITIPYHYRHCAEAVVPCLLSITELNALNVEVY